MLEKVHEHIVSELHQGARTDTIFVIPAIVFNLIVLAVNSAVASDAADSYNATSSDIVMIVFIILLVIVNVIAITALTVGKTTRFKLLTGLLKMYEDNQVSQYYDVSLLTNYNRRYTLFTVVILGLAITAVSVPLIIRYV
jgi:hypothetical protein